MLSTCLLDECNQTYGHRECTEMLWLTSMLEHSGRFTATLKECEMFI